MYTLYILREREREVGGGGGGGGGGGDGNGREKRGKVKDNKKTKKIAGHYFLFFYFRIF